MPDMAQHASAPELATGRPVVIRIAQAWHWQITLIVPFVLAAGWGLISSTILHPAHPRVNPAIQLALGAAIVATLAALATKGRRARIEVWPDKVIVRRCWLPNRQVSRAEVRGYQFVLKSVHGQYGVSIAYVTYVSVLLTSNRRLRTLGAATLQGRLGKRPEKVKRLLNDADATFSQLDMRYVGYEPRRGRKRR
jgi:hypothetical protein